MLVKVVRPFRDLDGRWKNRGEVSEMDDDRAAKLRRYNLVEKAIAPPPERSPAPEAERAVAPGPEETAERKPRGRPRKSEAKE